MLVVGALDYTLVISATIAGVFSLLNTVLAIYLAKQIRVPSGNKLGEVMERTHALAAVSVKSLHKLNGDDGEPQDDTTEDAA